jgi:hypothetical protein
MSCRIDIFNDDDDDKIVSKLIQAAVYSRKHCYMGIPYRHSSNKVLETTIRVGFNRDCSERTDNAENYYDKLSFNSNTILRLKNPGDSIIAIVRNTINKDVSNPQYRIYDYYIFYTIGQKLLVIIIRIRYDPFTIMQSHLFDCGKYGCLRVSNIVIQDFFEQLIDIIQSIDNPLKSLIINMMIQSLSNSLKSLIFTRMLQLNSAIEFNETYIRKKNGIFIESTRDLMNIPLCIHNCALLNLLPTDYMKCTYRCKYSVISKIILKLNKSNTHGECNLRIANRMSMILSRVISRNQSFFLNNSSNSYNRIKPPPVKHIEMLVDTVYKQTFVSVESVVADTVDHIIELAFVIISN